MFGVRDVEIGMSSFISPPMYSYELPITSSTFVLLRIRLKSQCETPNFRGAKTSWGIELKIGWISYLGGLMKREKSFKFATLRGSSGR